MVPIIRSPRGNAAEAVAEALDKKIRDNLRDTRNSMFTDDNIHTSSSVEVKVECELILCNNTTDLYVDNLY